MASLSYNIEIEMNSATDIKIRQLIKDKLGKDEWQITDDANFRDDLEVDSLDFTELIVSIEKEFNISIPDEAFEKLKTVGALIKYVEKLIDPFDTTHAAKARPAKVADHEPELEEQETF